MNSRLRITGVVRNRPDGTINTNLKSGKVEVLCHELEVLNASVTPPFQLTMKICLKRHA